jgi:predicted lysophospholipase L1 biosynthesis ABC-type transport system permease subunit
VTAHLRFACRLPAPIVCVLCLWPCPSAAQAPASDVLITRQFAAEAGLAPGDVVRLGTRADGTGARAFRIAGLYEPTPDPARLGAVPREVRMHLPDLLALTRDPNVAAGSESIDGINVALVEPDGADAFVGDVNARLPGVRAVRADRAGDAAGTFTVIERFHVAIATVTIAAATVFLLALTIMLVDERRETVGILRLIGLPVRRILTQILLEGLFVAAAGAALGLLLALLSEGVINRFFQWRYDTTMLFVAITPRVALLCAWIAVPLGASATVLASWALLRRGGLRLVRR